MAGLELYWRGPTGAVRSIDLSPDATIHDLKLEIEKTGGPPVARQVIRFGDRIFKENGVFLAECGLSSEVTLDVQAEDPGPNPSVLACGDKFSCCVLEDGSIATWGQIDAAPSGYLTTSPGEDPVKAVSVSAGSTYAVGLLNSGSAIVWGKTTQGEGSLKNPRHGKFIGVAAGASHVVGVTKKHEVVVCGSNSSGQRSVPGLPGEHIVSISAGTCHCNAVFDNGKLLHWGGGEDHEAPPEDLLCGRKATQVSSGKGHSIALLDNGKVVCWGFNDSGRCNPPEIEVPCVSVAAGFRHSLALTCDGRVIAWGNESDGKTAVPKLDSPAVSIAAGKYHSLAALADGKVVAWGWNHRGQCNVPDFGGKRVFAL
eukprot:TRINITY_DN11423_c0_g1_i2.p1 TRINITY_DN11423_c0_g1~~TRINITY_DN11423_c0_g1_i2.p1  ORF type:complete len:369 (+),score=30.64 TRINITY_DN11423_c0_g1_i2:59-1165(+)